MPDSPYARALSACLASGDAEMRVLALQRLDDAFQATGGNAVRSAALLDVAHRTLMRWVASDPEVLSRLNHWRDVQHDSAVTPDKFPV